MKRRKRPEHSWDRLNGTRIANMDLPGGVVRQLMVDVDDPMPAIVSFGRHALTHNATGHVLRFVTVDNFNNDPRELHQIPEARAWFRRLWHEGKPLLRLLSESSWDMPADDRLGLSALEVTYLGLGWREVYMLGMCQLDGERIDGADGPAWCVDAVLDRPMEEIRAELLQMSEGNPEGFTFDDAANRRLFVENNMPAALDASRVTGPAEDMAVLVLSLLDDVAGKLAAVVTKPDERQRVLADSRERSMHPAAVVGVPRELAAKALHPFAPEAATRMGKGRPESGWHWVAFVAFNGTTLATLNPPGTANDPG